VTRLFIALASLWNLTLAPVAAAQWDKADVASLLAVADALPASGLAADRYAFESLLAAAETGDGALDAAASTLFRKIARDLAAGVVQPSARVRWRIPGPILDAAIVDAAIEAATASDSVASSLLAYEPPHADYRALKAALALAGDDDRRARRLALNMERWRWMPRDLGDDYVFINIPAFEAIIVRGGIEVSRRRVIVGAPKTPTWAFAARIEGVGLNPTWYVPSSIVDERVGALLEKRPKEAARLGYYKSADGGIRQKPGPQNALGRMKLIMPNPHSIFMHDTPEKALFTRERRAFSHGCIRVEEALDFAVDLLGGEWDRGLIDAIVEAGETTTVNLAEPIPVYVGYFTAWRNADGEVTFHDDIYRLDAGVSARVATDERAGPAANTECAAL